MEGIHSDYVYRAAMLLTKFLHKTLNDEERSELNNWINTNETNRKIFEDLKNEEKLESDLKSWNQKELVIAFDRIKKRIQWHDALLRKMRILHLAALIAAIALSAVLWVIIVGSHK
ncbi:MAG: hypothetical protein C5B52_08505 [Bacteroidetes bacterium]|nr:MAG: hypothetical protein C5B52_08505 [Bacteroidota bacterium]